jgi:hypothetical protein
VKGRSPRSVRSGTEPSEVAVDQGRHSRIGGGPTRSEGAVEPDDGGGPDAPVVAWSTSRDEWICVPLRPMGARAPGRDAPVVAWIWDAVGARDRDLEWTPEEVCRGWGVPAVGRNRWRRPGREGRKVTAVESRKGNPSLIPC